MRTVLSLFALCLSMVVLAKDKPQSFDVNTPGVLSKSIENAGLALHATTESPFGQSVLHSATPLFPTKEKWEASDYTVFHDHFFNDSVNSYNLLSGSSGGTQLSSMLSLFPEMANLDSGTLFRQGMFYGFTVMLILLNLTCFFLFAEKPFLFYALTLASMALLLFFSDGLLGLFFVEFTRSIAMETTMLFIAVGIQALFASRFLSLKEFAPKLKFVTFFMMGVAMVACLFNWFTKNPVFAHVANLSLFAVVTSYFLTGVSLFSKKNYAKFYVIATFIPLLFAIDFYILRPLGVEILAVNGAHLKGAAIAEMLILTYGIMYRMQAIKEENELRQVEMRIFLRRQEVMNARRKTEKLVEDVYLENLIMHYDLDGLEIKLLQYISEGKENHKIARKLKMSEADVEDLTKELYEKLEIGEQIQQDYRLVDQQPDYIYN